MGESPLAEIAKITYRGGERSNMVPVPDWRDIQALSGQAHSAAIAAAARHVWSWVHARCMLPGPREFVMPARLSWTKTGKPVLSGDVNGRDGWRWDGVVKNVYTSLWPSIGLYIDRADNDPDPEAQKASAFRKEVSGYLRTSGNLACVAHGPQYPVPQWFVAKEWIPAPALPSKSSPVPSPLAKAEKKLTPEQAGETKAPAPVKVEYKCRHPGCDEKRGTEALRNVHEKVHVPEMASSSPSAAAPAAAAPAAATTTQVMRERVTKSLMPSKVPVPCRKCGRMLSNLGNRSFHELNMHPEMGRDMNLYPYHCLRCTQAFTTLKGLSIHLTKIHGYTSKSDKYLRILNAAQETAQRWREAHSHSEHPQAPATPASTPDVRTATAHAAQPEEPSGAVQGASAATPANAALASLPEEVRTAVIEMVRELRVKADQYRVTIDTLSGVIADLKAENARLQRLAAEAGSRPAAVSSRPVAADPGQVPRKAPAPAETVLQRLFGDM